MNKQKSKARIIAFYLPQFHPIPENDEWWGKGFTDWTNVAKAKIMFNKHYQPHIPADLGFYDLRVSETRVAQAEMAQEYGVEGFCYWHYWLGNGRRLLERPFEEVLNTGQPDFPFCLGWANVDWTGDWGGQPHRTLVKQDCSQLKDFEEHFNYLLEAFADERYITVDGKPLFYIHRPHNIPNVKKIMDYWRELALKRGLKGLHLVGNNIKGSELEMLGFDAYSLHYPDHGKISTTYFGFKHIDRWLVNIRRILNRPAIVDYETSVINNFPENYSCDPKHYPLVIPNWDNTPRVGSRGVVFIKSSPKSFKIHLTKVIKKVENKQPQQRIVFLKSWNEWAEGNYVEPDQIHGHGYLQAIKDVLTSSSDIEK